MHLFFDTVLKLHIGEIPEKPNPKNYLYPGPLVSDLKQYEQAIAAIKQNALTVGNPGVIASKLDSLEWVGRIDKADVYKWPGGYRTKETPENRDGRLVAILKLPNGKYQNKCCKPLPEEKKNTMENKEVINSDKEFLNWIYERMICVHGEKDLYDYMINFKAIIDRSGSVAAPNIEKEIRNRAIDECIEKLKLIVNGSELIEEFESLKL